MRGSLQKKAIGFDGYKPLVNRIAAIKGGDNLPTRTWSTSVADPVVAQPFPYMVDVQEGEIYKWCACGRSSTQPFCDDSHDGTGLEPVLYVAESTKRVPFCGCKASKRGAICDSTHNSL